MNSDKPFEPTLIPEGWETKPLQASPINKSDLYDKAFQTWGFDKQLLKTAEEASELSAVSCRMLNCQANGHDVAEGAADMEIMIEQLRHNGMNDLIDAEKERKLARLALLLEGCADIDSRPDRDALQIQVVRADGAVNNVLSDLNRAVRDYDFAAISHLSRKAAGCLFHFAQVADRVRRLAESTEGGANV